MRPDLLFRSHALRLSGQKIGGRRKSALPKSNENFARTAQFSEFAPGDHVISTGGPADSFYVILGGEAKAFARPAARTLGAGDYFGELALIVIAAATPILAVLLLSPMGQNVLRIVSVWWRFHHR